MNIELYSIKSITSTVLKRKLEDALVAFDLPYEVNEVHNIDTFLKAGLHSIPAIRVGTKILEYREDESLEVTIQRTIDMIHSVNEKHLLVPVDFTPESIHALRYARILAKNMGMEITVVHVHQTLFDAATGSSFDMDMMAQNRKKLDEMLIEAGWDKVQVGGHVPIHVHFETGDISSHLETLMEDSRYEMIIMSTKSEDSLIKRMFGSVSTQVSQKIHKPVIIIPPQARLQPPTKVVIGLTGDMMDGNTFKYVLSFADNNRLFIEFIFATNIEQKFDEVKNRLQQIVKGYKELAGFSINLIPLNEDSLQEDLMRSASQLGADMLILLTKHRNFFQKLGHHSITTEAVNHPVMPVMVMHED